MIAKLAEKTALFFAKKNVYEYNKIDIYKYGFELLISTIINSFCIFLISILLGIVFEALLFVVAFIPLRLSAGGYHAKHHWSCILSMSITFSIFALILKYMNSNFVLLYSISTVFVSSLLIWAFSPVEAVNKPLKDEQREKQRSQSILLVSMNMAVATISYLFPLVPKIMIAFYVSGMLAASLLLVVAIATNKTKRSPSQ
jgi:accessory gene regulator B